MSSSLLIATAFSIGFFVESIIGFGGGLIAYAILGFFIDVKQMVLAGLYIGTCASAYIIYSDHKNFAKKIFFSTLPICFIGTAIGVFAFSKLSSNAMLSILGALSIFLSLRIIFFENVKFPKFLRNFLLLIGGISHGLFGIGGPFIVNALQGEFKNKSELRTTMASFFVTFNILRFTQLLVQKQIKPDFFFNVSWTIIPVFIAIFFGFKVHLKIDEKLFKKMIAAMTFFAGIVFLFK
jgi:uncharacterized membrane protein YfcA